MTRIYDDWERLVEATLDREELREIALASSRETSSGSSISARFSSGYSFKFKSVHEDPPADGYHFTKPIKLEDHVIRPIMLADLLIKAAEEAAAFKEECLELKSKAEKLSRLLRQVARERDQLYERPACRIVNITEDILDKALSLVMKCRGSRRGVKRMFNNITTAAFREMSLQLGDSIGNVSWILQDELDCLGVPPIAADEPILCTIWELIAIIYTGSVDDQCSAAASLVLLAQDSDLHRKSIVKEGGVRPLLGLVKEGKVEPQENAVRLIGLLGKDVQNVFYMREAGVCSMLARILIQGPKKVQPTVLWALSELTAHGCIYKHNFEPHNNIVKLLISHLVLGTRQEPSSYGVGNLATSNGNINGMTMRPDQSFIVSQTSSSATEDDPATEDSTKEVAARALWQLAEADPSIRRSVVESTVPLIGLAVLLEKGSQVVQYYSAMTLMKVTAWAEYNAHDFRRLASKSNYSAVWKLIVDQLCRIMHEEAKNPKLLVPCVKAIGNLARTSRATDTIRMISPLVEATDTIIMISSLVELLEDHGAEVSKETCIALTKLACFGNYLCVDQSKAILAARGARKLVELVYFGEQSVQSRALILLCYIAQNVPGSKELAQVDVLLVLDWASKQSLLIQDENVKKFLTGAVHKLERYQRRRY